VTNISTTDFTDGVTSRTSAALDTNFTNCATVLNGGVDNANFLSNAGINVQKIVPGADGLVFARQGGVNAFVGGWAQLANVELGSDAATIDFTNIPQSFWKLHLVLYGRCTEAVLAATWRLRFNGDTAGNYYYGAMVSGGGAFAFGQAQAATSILMGSFPGSTATSTYYGSYEVVIPGCNQTKLKHLMVRGGEFSSAANTVSFNERRGGMWNSTAAITSISLFPNTGSFVAGTRVALFGVS